MYCLSERQKGKRQATAKRSCVLLRSLFVFVGVRKRFGAHEYFTLPMSSYLGYLIFLSRCRFYREMSMSGTIRPPRLQGIPKRRRGTSLLFPPSSSPRYVNPFRKSSTMPSKAEKLRTTSSSSGPSPTRFATYSSMPPQGEILTITS